MDTIFPRGERQSLIDTFLTMNSQLNLSAIRDAEGVYVKHILDSLELTKILDLTQYRSVCDVGTWWGFPLLALAKEVGSKIVGPTQFCGAGKWDSTRLVQTQFTGIDARRKKVDAVNTMIAELWLTNAKAIRSRIEDHHQIYDIVTARAVAYITELLPRCVPLCRVGGLICLYKQDIPEEYDVMMALLSKYKLQLKQKHFYRLFDGDVQRVIYVLEKK